MSKNRDVIHIVTLLLGQYHYRNVPLYNVIMHLKF